jgi:hypothetical protein
MALLKFPTDFFVLPILLSDSEQKGQMYSAHGRFEAGSLDAH